MIPANRAGCYVKQDTGYKAFIPASLPPSPPVEIQRELQYSLSLADRALGRLDGSITTLPNPDLFVMMYVKKEAVLSSQIEGTQSSLQDLLAAEAHVFSDKDSGDVKEVINYVNAMNTGLQLLNELPVSMRLIREIHAILLKDVRGSHATPGEIRHSQNWIGSAGSTIATATFVPPPPHELNRILSDFEKFIHEKDDIPILIKIGLIHAQFESIHPFLDGNGRIGRLLITFLLMEKGVLQKPILYLSHFFKKNRQEYYERLQNVRDHGDWESWLSFFLTGIDEVSRESVLTVRRILEMREEHRLAITDKLGRSAGNGHKVLEILFQSPVITVKDVENITGTTYAAANTLVTKFRDIGILKEISGHSRNRRFLYHTYASIFNDD